MEIKTYTYEGASVEEATEKGLKELGLTADRANVVVRSYGGIFTKPTVEITPKEEAEAPVAEAAPAEKKSEEKESNMTEEELDAAETRAKEFVTALVAQMKLDCAVTVNRIGDEIIINLTGEDAGTVIGYRGETLDAIQYMTLWIANRQGKDFVRVSLDAENYRKKRKETLTTLAERLARKCSKSGRRVELEPMNPFERRVIHTALQDSKYVTTISEGEGRFRHVVIVPKQGQGKSDLAEEGDNMSYGTSTGFRRKGIAKTKSYGASKRRF